MSKFLLFVWIFILSIYFFGCATLKERPKVEYMAPDDVVKAFETMQKEATKTEEMEAPADVLRTLTPNDEFLGTKKEDALKHKTPVIFRSNGVKIAEPKAVDLRSKDAPIVSQWDGTCTAHGLAGVVENLSGFDLSERHIWSRYQRYSCESAINAWKNYGACITTEKGWKHGNTKPSLGYKSADKCFTFIDKTTYIGASLPAMMASLDAGRPVYIGMQVTKSMASCSAVLNPLSKGTSGGHALSVVGYKQDDRVAGGGYFTVRNSWGSDCGDKGYQHIPFNYCIRDDLYCIMWTVDSIDVHGAKK